MGKSYLVEGARLKCICGSKCSSLKVTDHGYRADGKKKANCKDCLAEINITDFGTCKMNQQGKVCKGFMKLAEQWENTGGDSWKLEKLSGHTALTMDSVLLCKRGGIIVPETSGQGAVRKINWGAHLARYGMNRLASSLGKKDGCLYGRDPVNLNTGNFLYEKEDLVIGGVTKISFRMYYNSMDEYRGGSLGEGWHHNYEMYAEQKKEGTVHLHLGDGREILYRPKLGDLYTPVFGDAGLLKKETDGYRYVTGSTEYAFGSDGFIRTMTDRNGNTDMFLYNDKGQLAEVKGANGGVLHYEYNREGNLYRVYDHTGREVRLWYSYRVLQKFQNSMGYVYTYGYNENLRLESVTTPRGIVGVKNVYDSANRVVKQVTPDGGVVEFCYDDEGMCTYERDQNGYMVSYESDDRFRNIRTVYNDSEELFQYNDDNRLICYTDRNGNRTRYSYDAGGNLTGITDALGTHTAFRRDGKGRLLSASINGKEVRKNSYDGKGRLLKVTDALGRTRETVYGDNGLPERMLLPDGSCIRISHDARGNIQSITDSYGCTVQYDYDELNRVIKTTDGEGNCVSYQYDAGSRLLAVTNQEGAVRSYAYNGSGKLIRLEDFDGSAVDMEYNAMGRPEKFTDKEGNRTKAAYDAAGNLAEMIFPTGLTACYRYDRDNRLVQARHTAPEQEDGKAAVTDYTYDGAGNLLHVSVGDGNSILRETSYEYDALNRVTAVTDSSKGRTLYDYDSVTGKVCRITDALGNQRTFRYNGAGELTEKTDIYGNTTRYEYNALGQTVSVTDGAGRTTRYSYLPGGRLEKTVYPDGRQMMYEYDGLGRVSRKTDGQGYSLFYSYDVLGRVQRISSNAEQAKYYAYDVMGNITAITDANGNTTRYAYTVGGKLRMVTDALGNRTEYAYDAADGLTRICQHGKAGEADRVTEYERDVFGRVTRIRDALGGEEAYCYDMLGRVTEKKDRDGLTTVYTYTAGGETESILYGDGCRAGFEYTPLGQLAAVRDWLGETRFERDGQGRISGITDHEGRSVRYEWGKMGEKRRMVYPDGTVTDWDYDGLLRPVEMKRTAKGQDTLWIQYRYDGQGRLAGKKSSGGYCTKWDYNGQGLLCGLVHEDASGILDQYRYGYDAMGNRTVMEKKRSGLQEESGRYLYTYDALHRLTGVEKDGEMLRSYRYDSFGNRTGMEDYGRGTRNDYAYDALNRIQEKWERQVTDWKQEEGLPEGTFRDGGVLHRTYTHDGRGNLTGEYQNGELLHGYGFNAMNRLAEAWNSEGEKAVYFHNTLGQRTGKDGSRGKESYLLDMGKPYHNLLWMENGRGKQKFYWDYGAAITEDADRGARYYLADELGSPLRVLYRSGKGDVYGYDEFGEDAGGPESGNETCRPYGRQGESQPFGFTGYRYDDIGGTYYAQAREYKAGMGRFTAEDVLRGNHAVPKTLNRYGYCWGNPMGYMDLDGRTPVQQMGANEILWDYFLNEVNHTITAWQIECYNAVESVKNDVKEVVDGSIEAFWRGMDAGMEFTDSTVHIVKDNLAEYDFTYSFGGGVTLTPGFWLFSGNIGLAMDTKGNMGIQGTLSSGVTIGLKSIAWGLFTSISNAPDIYALEKEGTDIGGSVIFPAILAVLGLDLNFLGDINKKPYEGYYGLTASVDNGEGFDLHVTEGYTFPIFKYVNVFDTWDRIYNAYTGKRCGMEN